MMVTVLYLLVTLMPSCKELIPLSEKEIVLEETITSDNIEIIVRSRTIFLGNVIPDVKHLSDRIYGIQKRDALYYCPFKKITQNPEGPKEN